jgi:transcriptional regulator with XRE-family HTH domain
MPNEPTPAGWVEFRTIRRKDGASLQQLSLMSGIAKGHLSDLETGKRKPTAAVIVALAKALNVPVSVLEPRDEPLTAEVIEAVVDARGEAVA